MFTFRNREFMKKKKAPTGSIAVLLDDGSMHVMCRPRRFLLVFRRNARWAEVRGKS